MSENKIEVKLTIKELQFMVYHLETIKEIENLKKYLSENLWFLTQIALDNKLTISTVRPALMQNITQEKLDAMYWTLKGIEELLMEKNNVE